MAYTYTRTITTSPEGALYTWNNPASSWITITQQGTSDSWNIEIADNTGGARSATLMVTHEDGTTTDSISVSQASGAPTPTVTATPTATPTPTATTPSSTFTMTSNTTGGTAVEIFGTTSSSPATVTYQLIVPSGQSPVSPTIQSPPSLIAPNGFTVNYPTSDPVGLAPEGQTVWNGTIDVWQMMSPTSTLTQEVVVSWAGQTDSFYVVATVSDDGGEIFVPR